MLSRSNPPMKSEFVSFDLLWVAIIYPFQTTDMFAHLLIKIPTAKKDRLWENPL